MSLDLTKYVKLWPFSQFVGLELVAGGLIYQRWHPEFGAFIAALAWLASAGAFAFIVHKEGLSTLFNIRRLLQAGGYLAMVGGFYLGLAGHGERGAVVTFVGTGFSMAGFVFDLIYP